jgi:uncharacterized membrane protein HdeD (DUF308 family)
VVGILGILAGLVVVTRFVLGRYASALVLGTTLGGVAIVVGLIHITGGFHTPGEEDRKQSIGSFALGVLRSFWACCCYSIPRSTGWSST